MRKNPINTFSIIVFPVIGLLVYFLFGFWGIGVIAWLWGIYLIMLLTSFIMKKNEIKYRTQIEWILIGMYVVFHSLYYVNFNVGTEIYLPNQEKPFVGKNQNFIIIFNVKGQKELPNNFFTNNKIYVPKNGIILTSSSENGYKQKYSFSNKNIMENFATSNFETCNCYGKENYKFEYIIGSVNSKGNIDYKFRDLKLDEICHLLNTGKIKNNLFKGYENKKNYLEQTEVVINNQNLIELPKGLLLLKNLESINIHSNSFGKFPKDIFNFPKLKSLTIGFNGIDSVPKRIREMQNLESLAINGNNIKDLPNEIFELPKLNYLHISENKFDNEELKRILEKCKKRGIEINYK
jgi:Leucine-rich repeat (LRR) protein